MNVKQFSERLNEGLDEIGVPPHNDERVEIFAKLVKLPRFKAESLLNGHLNPDPTLLSLLAEVLEVNSDWLIGKTNKKEQEH